MAVGTLQHALALAAKQHHAGQLAEAEQTYRHVLARFPDHPDAMHRLGVIHCQTGKADLGVDLIRSAAVHSPDDARLVGNLGIALAQAGRLEEAIASFRRAIELAPNYPEAYFQLANTLRRTGQLDDAIDAYRRVVALRPRAAEVHVSFGIALAERGRLDEAIAAYRKAIDLNGGMPEAHCYLGVALKEQGHLDEAIAAYRRAIALSPDHAPSHNNLGIALFQTGLVEEAMAEYRRALTIQQEYRPAHSNLLFAMHFHPAYDAQAIAQEHRNWGQMQSTVSGAEIRDFFNDRTCGRRLKVGYVSPDFGEHPLGRLLLPVLVNHDKSKVEVFAYADVPAPDAMTRRLRSYVDCWRSTVGLSDAQMADLVRQDKIDILVDLSMHMARNRLTVFAMKPAPVQVSWLAYPSTTGLTAIDYRLSDPFLDPPCMDESIYSEKTVRLPDCYWCYDPLDCADLTVNELPSLDRDGFTFGCLNNLCKINNEMLGLWARVMQQVKNSRLLLLANEGHHRKRIADHLGEHGISKVRLEFIEPRMRRKYLEQYHLIDLGLDCYPYNGHTTSLDSFWMGVPVITLMGATSVSRGGWCQLSNLGLQELAAKSPNQFVSIAANLATDLPRLAALRSTLRGRMERSPLMDAQKFARNLESAFEVMWRNWCGI